MFFRVTQTEEAKDLIRRYEELMRLLREFEESVFNEWREKIPEQIVVNLQKSLIVRDENTRLLTLNFSPQLFAILKEVHYLKLMEKEEIPEVGTEFSSKSEVYRGYTLSLEKTIDYYNQVLNHSTKCELELIQEEVKTIDILLTTGISELTWNSESKYRKIHLNSV